MRFVIALFFISAIVKMIRKVTNLFASRPIHNKKNSKSSDISSDNIIDAEFEEIN